MRDPELQKDIEELWRVMNDPPPPPEERTQYMRLEWLGLEPSSDDAKEERDG